MMPRKPKRPEPIVLRNWNIGGISESRIMAENNESLYKMIGTDIHNKIGLLTSNRRLANSGGAVIDSFVQNQVACTNGNTYAFSSESGKVWEWDGTEWTLVYTIIAPTGDTGTLGAIQYNDAIYFSTQNYLYRIQASLTDDWDANVELVGKLNVDPTVGDNLFQGGTDATFTLTTGIVETALAKIPFAPSLDNVIGVAISLNEVPATSLTVVLHDSGDNIVASKVVLNADLDTGINEIYLASTYTYDKNETFHFHIYKTGADGILNVGTVDDMSTAYFSVFGEGGDLYHPMLIQSGNLFIGDRYYIHQVEGRSLALWALDIPSHHTIKALGKIGNNLLITTETVNNVHSAMIFNWLTWSVSWSLEDDIPERVIHAVIPVDNFVYVIAGNKATVYFYNGSQLEKWRRVGGEFEATDAMQVYPNAVASLDGIPLIGLSNSSGNPMESGVYGMGTENPRIFPRVFDLEFVPSAGLEDLEIGSIVLLGDQIFVSWRLNDGGYTYGIDMFDNQELYSGTEIRTRMIYQNRNVPSVYDTLWINYLSIQGADNAVTCTASTNTLAISGGHGFQNGEEITLAGTIPTEFTAGTTYYVVNRTLTTFQLSATSGGSAITFALDGSGTITQKHLVRAYYRTDYSEGDWVELTLNHDTETKQFKSDSFGAEAFCLELKIELRARGTEAPVIDEITLDPSPHGV